MASASLAIGSFLSFLAVLLGAFGAHALRARVSPEMLAVWKTGNEYHFYHALALVLVGVLARTTKMAGLGGPAICFLLGVLVFSGSLYLLSLTGLKWMGAITPFGGLAFMIGWLWLAWVAARS